MKNFVLLTCTTLLIAACAETYDTSISSSTKLDSRTKIAFGVCASPINDQRAICGSLTVPESRELSSSRLLSLPFVILPANAKDPATDPVVLFSGGPGPSAIKILSGISQEQLARYPLRETRDLIVLDQRGAELTLPQSLDCAELDINFLAGERFESTADIVAKATKCSARLQAAGANLASYDTQTIARDLDELRQLLGKARGFTQWNIVGTSFGSRVAQVSMRDAPQGIRSVVLDGPFPLSEQEVFTAAVLDSLSEITQSCKAQPSCDAAFPNLQARFSNAIETLESKPVQVGGQRLTGGLILRQLRLALTGATIDPSIALFMDSISRSDWVKADTLIPILSAVDLAPNIYGMYYSIVCREITNAPLAPNRASTWSSNARQIAAQGNAFPSNTVCASWPSGRADPSQLQLINSSIPTLLTVGQFDAATPVVNANLISQNFRNSQTVVLPGKGHGLVESDACMLSLAVKFIQQPANPIDRACATQLPANFFSLE